LGNNKDFLKSTKLTQQYSHRLFDLDEERDRLLQDWKNGEIIARQFHTKVLDYGTVMALPELCNILADYDWSRENPDARIITRDTFSDYYVGRTCECRDEFLMCDQYGILFTIYPDDLTYHLWCTKPGMELLEKINEVTGFWFSLPNWLPIVEKDTRPGSIQVDFERYDEYRYYRTVNFEIIPRIDYGIKDCVDMIKIKGGHLAKEYENAKVWRHVYKDSDGNYILPVPANFRVDPQPTKVDEHTKPSTGELRELLTSLCVGFLGVGLVIFLMTIAKF